MSVEVCLLKSLLACFAVAVQKGFPSFEATVGNQALKKADSSSYNHSLIYLTTPTSPSSNTFIDNCFVAEVLRRQYQLGVGRGITGAVVDSHLSPYIGVNDGNFGGFRSPEFTCSDIFLRLPMLIKRPGYFN